MMRNQLIYKQIKFYTMHLYNKTAHTKCEDSIEGMNVHKVISANTYIYIYILCYPPCVSALGYLLQRLRRCSSTAHGCTVPHPPPVDSSGENYGYGRKATVRS